MTVAERLATAGFGQMPSQNPRFCLYFREPFVSLVEVATGQMGAVMVMTPQGPATILGQGVAATLVGNGFAEPADAAVLEGARTFAAELRQALSGSDEHAGSTSRT